MTAKFLFQAGGSVEKQSTDKKEGSQSKGSLLIVRKHDLFQHSDMKKIFNFNPSNGGFVNDIGKRGKEVFFGKSISCRVLTDDSMVKVYNDLIENGDWFKYKYLYNGRTPFTVFCCVEKDHYPASILDGIKWDPVKYEDINSLMEKEIQVYLY